ncbi:BTB domain-containing protein [Madurella fahalii]|uniref:BTB domain-containing protein n=1 Tax=Madurella fahalii TaxID=1157608 RepID=A0ABQ0G2Q7_9PEZI
MTSTGGAMPTAETDKPSTEAAKFLANSSIAKFLAANITKELLGRLERIAKPSPSTETPILSLSAAIDAALEAGRLSASDVANLRFIKAVYSFTENVGPSDARLVVCGWMLEKLSQPEATKPLLERLAEVLFPKADLDETAAKAPAGVTVAALKSVGTALYNAEPLTVLLVLVRWVDFYVSPGAGRNVERITKAAEHILSAMVQGGLEMGASELLASVRALKLEATEEELRDAVDLVASLKSLSRLAEDPEHVLLLFNQRYQSVRQISQTAKGQFTADMLKVGMERDSAFKIHDCATHVDCWNEHLWLELMQARRAGFIPIEPRSPKEAAGEPDGGRPGTLRNNLTDIFLLEDTACEMCCSVTSLSAYFADLLGMLDAIRAPSGATLLAVLSERRPDLRKLELSCANAQTLIPYIALVNEVLESFIRYNAKPRLASTQAWWGSVRTYNTPEQPEGSADGHSAEPVYRPGNTDYEVYTIVSKQMFPFAVFPYNQARDAIAQYFATFKVSMQELLQVFGAPDLLLQDLAPAVLNPAAGDASAVMLRQRLARGAEEVLERQHTAEVLGLQQADFAAITGETFFPGWLADILTASSSVKGAAVDRGCPWDAATLWGYKAKPGSEQTPVELMLDITHGTGLSFIKRQLMARSGLTFQDVLDLVQTQYLGHHLVITNDRGAADFDNSLEKLRLLSYAAQPPFQPLTEDICFALQSFMRLQAKLRWPTKQLDAAIFCLRNKEMAMSPTTTRTGSDRAPSTSAPPRLAELLSISPFVVRGIASLVMLSDLTGIEPAALLPLWGPIDSFGNKSLLHRRFLTPAAGEVDALFKIPASGRYFLVGSGTTPLYQHRAGVCASLEWPLEHIDSLLGVTCLEDADLDVDTLSILYRHVLLCRILAVPPSEAGRFLPLFFDKTPGDPLATPTATLAAIRRWKTLLDGGWTLQSLTKVLQPPPVTDSALESEGLRIAAAIRDGARELRKSLPFVYAGKSPTVEDVADSAAHAFDAATAKLVTEFVEGTQVQSETISMDKGDVQKLLEAAKKWPRKLSTIPEFGNKDVHRVEFKLTGILTAVEKEEIKNAVLPASVKDVLAKLITRSLEPQKLIRTRFNAPEASPNILLQDYPPTKLPAESSREPTEAEQMEAEMQVRERRRAFVDLASPTIVQDRLETLIINAVMGLVPNLDASMVSVLVSNIVQVPPSTSQVNSKPISAMAALQELTELGRATPSPLSEDSPDAYFTPSTTDLFTLEYVSSKEDSGLIRLTVNGLEVPFNTATNTFKPFRMTGGQPCHLQATFPLSRLRWCTPKVLKSTFTAESLLAATTTRRAAHISAAITRVASICQTLQLTAEEVEYLSLASSKVGTKPATDVATAESGTLAVDLNAPTLGDLVCLHQYRDLRDSSRAASSSSTKTKSSSGRSLVSLFSWLSAADAPTSEVLASEVAACTGWKVKRLSQALAARFPSELYSNAARAAALRLPSTLLALQAVMRLDERLAAVSGIAAQPSMSMLFNLAQPRRTLGADDTGVAKSLHTRLGPAQRNMAQDQLMENQRRALVGFLLQQGYVRDLGIGNADGLFEYFLIDVQMGPQLRTSRIKQAISSVQLFVQRCLLGLESQVPRGVVRRERWEWMQQYSLWEAHRKLFLYPENWLDPTLRDDKSHLFEEFEATLMQKDLNLATFLEGIKAYVYGLNDISSLEVVSYLHEPQPGIADVFHLFGRTRAAPYGFYYRTLTVLRYGPGGELFWRPWKKIDMDIPLVDSEWDGRRLDEAGTYLLPLLNRGRLYLFMPQIQPKTLAQGTGVVKATKFEDLRTTDISSTTPQNDWEVTMGWTELMSGSWAPKRMCAGALTIKADAASAGEFRIDPILMVNNYLSLAVSHSSKQSGAATVFGAFAFGEGHIGKLKNHDGLDAPNRLFPTSFQRITVDLAAPEGKAGYNLMALRTDRDPHKGGDRDTTGRAEVAWVPAALDAHISAGDKKTSPLPQKPVASITWTLAPSSSGQNFTGLVLSVKHSDGSGLSYFNVPKSSLLTTWWSADKLRDEMDLSVLDHTFSRNLMQAAADPTDPLTAVFATLRRSTAEHGTEAFGARKGHTSHELGQPSALYNWEIGLHTVLLAVDRLFATQQFEEALQVARLVFDPTVDGDVERLVKRVTTQKPGDSSGKPTETVEVVVSPLVSSAEALLDPDQASKTTMAVETRPTKSCWRFPPFQDMAAQIAAAKGEVPVDMNQLATILGPAVLERRSHGALVHAAARGRPQAYMKWIIMKYAEILIASGDVHFRQGTLESLPLATQRYVEAAHVLGPAPPKVPQLGKRKGSGFSYDGLKQKDIKFELGLPFSAELRRVEGATRPDETDPRGEKVVCFLRTAYFCVPLNPKLKQLRDLVTERLFNIRNMLDIQGRPVTYSLVEPLIDPGALMALSGGQRGGAGFSDALAMVMGQRESPLPRQRFDVLVQRALELCSELRGLGERMLSAVERKEGEAFALLRAKYTTAIHRLMLDIKNTQLSEAQQAIEALQLNRESQESQLAFYLELMGEPSSRIPKSQAEPWYDIEQDIEPVNQNDDMRRSRYEKEEMDKAATALTLNAVSAGVDGLVAALSAIPTATLNVQPMGIGMSVSAGGSNMASVVQAGSAAIKVGAMIIADQGTQAGRKAQLVRQLQERRLQANLRGREIKAIDQQIEIQKTRVRSAVKEVELQQAEIDDAVQMEAWYRTKYSGEQLYGWMEKQLRGLYYQAYTLALGAARRAESALSFEQGRNVALLRPGGYWDASRDGLLAADHLYLDLKRLENAQLEGRGHDYEVTKTVSLSQLDPLALLRLRLTGSTTFTIPEMAYDMDFPGHYIRRIRSVAVSMPAVVGPYSGVNATLTLLQHKYRVSQYGASTGDEYAASGAAPAHEAFRTDHVPISSVAISSGANDAGVFELAFSGPRYMPFEGAGAISTWRLELPGALRRFDYETISDVLLHVRYTAREGGVCLRAAANAAIRTATQVAAASAAAGGEGGLWAMWDLKNDFANQWYGFGAQLAALKNKNDAETEAVMGLGGLRERLPYWTQQGNGAAPVQVRSVALVSRDATLVDGMKLSAAADRKDGGSQPEQKWDADAVGDWRLRTRSQLSDSERKLHGWEIRATSSVLGEKGVLDGVYLLVRYVLVGSK